MICKCYPPTAAPTPRFHVWPITRPRTAAICEYGVYVVVNFLSQLISIFPLFLGMVMLLMNLKQRKNKN